MKKPTTESLRRSCEALRRKFKAAGKRVVVIRVSELEDLINMAIGGKRRRA